jgi:hypothetical protein
VCPTRTITPSAIGRVHSPGFAGNYGANLNCKLTLNVPSNKEVEISYNHVDIECKCTTMTIHSKTLWLKSYLYVCMAIKHIIVLFVETPRKFITAKLSIRKPGSSSEVKPGSSSSSFFG